MKPKQDGFFKRWKKGMMELSPVQYAHAKMTAYLWGTLGLILALTTMWFKNMWYFTLFMIGMIYLQWTEFRNMRREYYTKLEMQREIEESVKPIFKEDVKIEGLKDDEQTKEMQDLQ